MSDPKSIAGDVVEQDEATPEFDLDPGALFATPDTKTVFLAPKTKQFPAGIWVTFKKALSYGESLLVQSALFRGMSTADIGDAAAGGTIFTDIGKQKRFRLASWIVDWNFPDAQGKAVKWPRSMRDRLSLIDDLDERVGDWLEKEVAKIEAEAKERSEAEPDDKDPLALVPTRSE